MLPGSYVGLVIDADVAGDRVPNPEDSFEQLTSSGPDQPCDADHFAGPDLQRYGSSGVFDPQKSSTVNRISPGGCGDRS